VIARLQKIYSSFADLIHQPVFLRNASRPGSGEQILQWFWLADSRKWIAQNRFDQLQDAQRGFTVLFHPMPEVFAEFRVEYSIPFNDPAQGPAPAVDLRVTAASLSYCRRDATPLIIYEHYEESGASARFP